AGHLATTRHADQEHRAPACHRHPAPGVLAPLTPTGLVEVRHRLLATSVRAASTGAATAAVVACSNWRSVPTRNGTPNPSSLLCGVVRFDKRYAPVPNPTSACTRGP